VVRSSAHAWNRKSDDQRKLESLLRTAVRLSQLSRYIGNPDKHRHSHDAKENGNGILLVVADLHEHYRARDSSQNGAETKNNQITLSFDLGLQLLGGRDDQGKQRHHG
jgi:hypothetical protein